jgi:transcription antitermination factor NusG
MEYWYTLHTKPNAEYQVVAALQERQIQQIYLPELVSPKVLKRRERKPFFPCYLFAKVDLATVGLSLIQWTPGLRRIIAFDNQPVPLADEVIDLIRYKLGEIEAISGWPQHTFQPGDTVRIARGPLQDMLAIFDRPTTSSRRVQVLLAILGHSSRVQIDVADLEKVSPSPETPTLKRSRRTRGRGRQINNLTV